MPFKLLNQHYSSFAFDEYELTSRQYPSLDTVKATRPSK